MGLGVDLFGWFRGLMPREDAFFDMFEAQAALLGRAAVSLRAATAGGDTMVAHLRDVSERESEADAVYGEVMASVRRSFVTPFDRSSIIALATSLDDAVDEMKKSGKTATVFGVTSFEPEMVEMAGVIVSAAEAVAELLPLLRDVGANSAAIAEATKRIGMLESQTDDLQDAARSRLHAKAKEDPANFHAVDFQVACDLLNHLERVGDRLEDVAKVASEVAIESA